jgi:hypothetical protein
MPNIKFPGICGLGNRIFIISGDDKNRSNQYDEIHIFNVIENNIIGPI